MRAWRAPAIYCAMSNEPAFAARHRAPALVAGPDARAFLDGLLTVDCPQTGAWAFGAWLTPQGKILQDLFVFAVADDAFVLDANAEQRDALLKRLAMFKLRAQVDVGPSDGFAVVEGDEAFDADHCAPDPRGPAFGFRGLTSPGAAADLAERATVEHLRRGAPELGLDYAPQSQFPTDVNHDLLNGVAYDKGCFVGQEVVSRMKRRGSIRKRTLIIEGPSKALAPGARVEASFPLGEVLSAHDGVGLAVIRTDRWAEAQTEGHTPRLVDGPDVALAAPGWFPAGAVGEAA